MLGRWCGEGTSNKYPRLASGDNTNWQVSDIYVYDGSYFRFKNLVIGYTLPPGSHPQSCRSKPPLLLPG